jgi:predicted lactoylglutathione lyase
MHPNFIILYVRDPGASARFYSALLDAAPVESSPTFVMFALQTGVMLGLWIRSGVAPSVDAPAGGSELAVSVERPAMVRELLERWRAAGAVITMEPAQLDFGYGFMAQDPDGHRIRVFSPPGR